MTKLIMEAITKDYMIVPVSIGIGTIVAQWIAIAIEIYTLGGW